MNQTSDRAGSPERFKRLPCLDTARRLVADPLLTMEDIASRLGAGEKATLNARDINGDPCRRPSITGEPPMHHDVFIIGQNQAVLAPRRAAARSGCLAGSL